MSRSFTVDSIFNVSGKKLRLKGGRYISDIPSSAARKAFSKMSKGMTGRVVLIVNIRETTQNSSHKIYKYKITRLYKPTKITIGDQTIIHKYITKVKSLN